MFSGCECSTEVLAAWWDRLTCPARPLALLVACRDALGLHTEPTTLHVTVDRPDQEYTGRRICSRWFEVRSNPLPSTMAPSKAPTLREQFRAFQSTARLDVLVPDVTEEELPECLEEGLATDLAHIPARRNLFFGIVLAHQPLFHSLTYRQHRRASQSHSGPTSLPGRRRTEIASTQSRYQTVCPCHRRRTTRLRQLCLCIRQTRPDVLRPPRFRHPHHHPSRKVDIRDMEAESPSAATTCTASATRSLLYCVPQPEYRGLDCGGTTGSSIHDAL